MTEVMINSWEAHAKGFRSAKAGQSKNDNPYYFTMGLMHRHWDRGWEHYKTGTNCIECPDKEREKDL